ncbi:MAG: HDOD domain-containing protein [Deltaproteobacteria bacterium]|nr:HDOD domain-containing protein [Deltaproteobacteria bacterium]
MQIAEPGVSDPGARKQVREYFREVSERCKLPPLPAVVATALRMVRNPDVNTVKLCRVLSDDAALVGRLFSVSRSAFYGRYSPPKTLPQALQVLGLRTVQRILVAATAQSLCRDNSGSSNALWDHSLAVALTAELLAKQGGARETESAFLGGLLHDVGQMVLLHGDPSGFSKFVQRVQASKESVVHGEKELYGSDHTLIGVVLMDCWDFDGEMGSALLSHHDDTVATQEPTSLAGLLRVADYLTGLAGLGFISEPLPPPAEALECWGCGSDETRDALVERVRQAFDAEKAMYS